MKMPPKRPRGRPVGSGLKRPGEKYRLWSFRLPEPLLARLRAAVPENERAAFVRQAVERALSERERNE